MQKPKRGEVPHQRSSHGLPVLVNPSTAAFFQIWHSPITLSELSDKSSWEHEGEEVQIDDSFPTCSCHLGHGGGSGWFPSPAQCTVPPTNVCVVTVMCVSLLLDKQPGHLPKLGTHEALHLWIRVPADDKAHGSWRTFAQDGVDFA